MTSLAVVLEIVIVMRPDLDQSCHRSADAFAVVHLRQVPISSPKSSVRLPCSSTIFVFSLVWISTIPTTILPVSRSRSLRKPRTLPSQSPSNWRTPDFGGIQAAIRKRHSLGAHQVEDFEILQRNPGAHARHEGRCSRRCGHQLR